MFPACVCVCIPGLSLPQSKKFCNPFLGFKVKLNRRRLVPVVIVCKWWTSSLRMTLNVVSVMIYSSTSFCCLVHMLTGRQRMGPGSVPAAWTWKVFSITTNMSFSSSLFILGDPSELFNLSLALANSPHKLLAACRPALNFRDGERASPLSADTPPPPCIKSVESPEEPMWEKSRRSSAGFRCWWCFNHTLDVKMTKTKIIHISADEKVVPYT